uniref:KRAB domain-containing protein n=1 Tax=Pseudonaja textilis TaxID=8673 RepID=A0A670ZQD8_PSETE
GGAAGLLRLVPAAFRDVAVCFSAEEWAELAGWQKDLYRDVMAETFQLVSSLGKSWKGAQRPSSLTPLLEQENPY